MLKHFAFLIVVLLGGTILAVPGYAQDTSQRPSPSANANCSFADGKTVTVAYSSPRAKGRKIYGGLVPYGKVWRAGANEATTIAIDTDVMIGGKAVPAGTYTIFTIPNEDKWTLILNKTTKNAKGGPLWGVPYPGEEGDFARVDMKASKLSSPVENFTISFDKSGSGCVMNLDWETTRASIEISDKK
ncbi:MAG: DUF2911 domain-containing protein [Candidatus Acidiferrales bacterium]